MNISTRPRIPSAHGLGFVISFLGYSTSSQCAKENKQNLGLRADGTQGTFHIGISTLTLTCRAVECFKTCAGPGYLFVVVCSCRCLPLLPQLASNIPQPRASVISTPSIVVLNSTRCQALFSPAGRPFAHPSRTLRFWSGIWSSAGCLSSLDCSGWRSELSLQSRKRTRCCDCRFC